MGPEVSVIALWMWMGCSGGAPAGAPEVAANPGAEPTKEPVSTRSFTFEFNDLKITDAMLTATKPTSTTWALVDHKRYDIGFQQVYARGDDGFGDLVDSAGQPVDRVCNNQDFNALFEAQGHPWLVSHFECTPGAVYLTRLAQDEAGMLTPEFNKRVDFSAIGGVWNPCAGQISPWGTHIGSEEYEPNARKVPVSMEEDGWDYRSWSQQEDFLPDGDKLNPYLYGWVPEIEITSAEGDSTVVKHKALGRLSHEIAYVLPDQRTVYMSDDGGAGGFFMFVADAPGDLSAGYLYAARWKQTFDKPIQADLRWINLGHADDASIDGLIADGVGFDDLFEVAEPDGFRCPDGFRFTHTDYVKECLRLRPPSEKVPDPKLAASRLETRRYAATLAATTEFEKGKGVAYDPASGTVYLALSKVQRRMEVEEGAPDDHIQLPKNGCGVILAGETANGVLDTGRQLIGSAKVITGFEVAIAGTPLDEPDARGNRCLESGIANPDNIAFLPGYDLLMVAEDTSKHAVAALWAYEMRRSVGKRVLVAPPHGEITGIHWSPNIGGHGYLSVAVQHPWRAEKLDESKLPDFITPADQRSLTGLIGPFPALD